MKDPEKKFFFKFLRVFILSKLVATGDIDRVILKLTNLTFASIWSNLYSEWSGYLLSESMLETKIEVKNINILWKSK